MKLGKKWDDWSGERADLSFVGDLTLSLDARDFITQNSFFKIRCRKVA